MKTTIENWQDVKIHFGKKAGTRLGDLSRRDLEWWATNWTPNDKFCKSKLTKTETRPAFSYIDDDEDGDGGTVNVPAREVVSKISDPANCPDCALSAALKAALAEPVDEIAKVLATVAPLPENLNCEFKSGEKVRRSVRIEKVSSWASEFNRKKVTTFGAYMRNCDALFYWKSSSMPDEITEGAELEIEGTVKDVFIRKDTSERAIALQRVKIVAGKILTPKAALVLFCDGKSSAHRIAVCDVDGQPIFAGHHSGDASRGDNTDHELAGALKAFEKANQAREAAGHDCISLELRFDAKWLEGMVGKAAPLREFARKHGLKVTMTHIAGTSNPADEWTIDGGEIDKAATLKTL